MTERQMQVRIGTLVLVAMLLFMGFVLSIGRRSALFEERYSLWTSFSSTEGLAAGAPVRLAGLTVGNVTRIAFGRDPKDRRIVLTLSVEQRVQDRIREDSVASIGTIGLVGDKVLDITVGSHDRPGLRPGAELASTDPPDYAQLLKKGDRILDNVTRITASLDEFLVGGESTGKRNLNEVLRSFRTTLVEVEKGQGLLHDIIYGREGAELLARMDRTVQSLEKVAKTVEMEGSPLLVRMDRTLQSVEKLAGTLETEAGPLLGRVDRTIQSLEKVAKSIEVEGSPLLVRMDRTLQSVEKLAGTLETAAGPLLGRVDRTVQSLENIVKALETEDGLLHALIYTPKDETLGRLTQSLNTLDEILRQARDGRGLLHMLLYESEGAELLARLNRTSEHLEGLARAAREGKGLLPSLLFDPAGAKVLEDVRDVAADLRGLAADMRGVAGDLQTITTRLRQGEGTIGGLLEDPTVYEDLSALLRGANRSTLLRSLIRSTREEGLREKR